MDELIIYENVTIVKIPTNVEFFRKNIPLIFCEQEDIESYCNNNDELFFYTAGNLTTECIEMNAKHKCSKIALVHNEGKIISS